MERRLFEGAEERKKRKELGVHALLHCQQERRKLRQCFRESWFGWCSQEQTAFWECFNKEKDRLELVTTKRARLPENHWGDPSDPSPSTDLSPPADLSPPVDPAVRREDK